MSAFFTMLQINSRNILTIICTVFILSYAHGAIANTDSLLRVYNNGRDASDRMHASIMLARHLMPANMDSALALIQLAEPLASDRQNLRKADYFNTYGLYYWYIGQHDKAIDMYAHTIGLKPSQNLLASRAMATNNMGALYNQAGQADSARKYLEIALAIDTERSNWQGMTKTMYDMGVLYLREDKYDLALKYLLQATAYQAEKGDDFRLAHSLNVIGNIFYEKDSLQKAAGYYHQSAALARKITNKSIELNAYNNLSAVFCKQPFMFDSTAFYVKKGLVLAQELRDTTNLLSLNHNLGIAYLTFGDAKRAIKHLMVAHEFVPSVNRPIIHARLLISTGKAYTILGNLEEARNLLNKAADISQQIHSLSSRADAFLQLSHLDSVQGNYFEALHHYQLSTMLRDSIYNRQAANRFAELTFMQESTQKALEFELLERKEKYTRIALIFVIITSILLGLAASLLVLYMQKRKITSEQQMIIHREESEKKQAMLETHQNELTNKAISLIKAEDLIKDLRKDISGIIRHAGHGSPQELKGLLTKIKREEKNNELWDDFASRFNELHDNFITKLLSKYPTLSPSEIRMCDMLRMQLTTKEIAELTRRSDRTIEYTRTNIRKKMKLNSCDNLTKHLLKI